MTDDGEKKRIADSLPEEVLKKLEIYSKEISLLNLKLVALVGDQVEEKKVSKLWNQLKKVSAEMQKLIEKYE